MKTFLSGPTARLAVLIVLLVAVVMPAYVAAADASDENWIGEVTIGNVTYKAEAQSNGTFYVYPFPKSQDIEYAVIKDEVDITVGGVSHKNHFVQGLAYDWGACPNLKWIAFDEGNHGYEYIGISFDYTTKPLLKNIIVFSTNTDGELSLYNAPSYLTVYCPPGWQCTDDKQFQDRFKGTQKPLYMQNRINPIGVKFEFDASMIDVLGSTPSVEATVDGSWNNYKTVAPDYGVYAIYGTQNKLRYTFPFLSQEYEVADLSFGNDINFREVACIGGYKFTVNPEDLGIEDLKFSSKAEVKKTDNQYNPYEWCVSANTLCVWSGKIDGFQCSGTINPPAVPQVKLTRTDVSKLAAKVTLDYGDLEVIPGTKLVLKVQDKSYQFDENNTAIVMRPGSGSVNARAYIVDKLGQESYCAYINIGSVNVYYRRLGVVGSHYTSIEVKLYRDKDGNFLNDVRSDPYFGEMKAMSVSLHGQNEWQPISEGKTVTFGNLSPNSNYDFDIKIDYDSESLILWDNLFTRSFSADYKVVHLGPTSFVYEVVVPEDDSDGGSFTGSWYIGGSWDTVDGTVYSESGQEPGSYRNNLCCKVEYYDKSGNYKGEKVSAKFGITTPALTWDEGTADALTKTKARIKYETNCDATEETGVEWRRVDAPDVVQSSVAQCPVVDGRLVGVLENLNPEVYYKYRPFYMSASGKYYYGDWVGIFTGDAGVIFKPEVWTGQSQTLSKNSVSLSGSVLPGSEDIVEQGFEWWQTNSPARVSGAGSNRGIIKADGIRMDAELTDLKYSTSYTYRAYAKTGTDVYYGAEQTFETEAVSGIEDVQDAASDKLTVALRENPVGQTATVKVSGCESGDAVLTVTSVVGAVAAQTSVPADGQWYPVELNLPGGLYLLTAVAPDGRHDTIRLIIR